MSDDVRVERQKTEIEETHVALIVISGLESSDNEFCKYAFSQPIFEKCCLSGMRFMKSSGSVVADERLHNHGLSLSWKRVVERFVLNDGKVSFNFLTQ